MMQRENAIRALLLGDMGRRTEDDSTYMPRWAMHCQRIEAGEPCSAGWWWGSMKHSDLSGRAR